MNVTEQRADIWVVAGPPGSGKTTVANILLKAVKPTPALLDKDTMYNAFDEAILAVANRPVGEREGPWYDEHIKQHIYRGLTATAQEVRSYGCPVLLCAPFTGQIHNRGRWHEWVKQLGGEPVHLIWVQTDRDTLKRRLVHRSSERDSQKLANFDKFIEYMQVGSPPPVRHFAIDNRSKSSVALEDQVANALVEYQRSEL